MLARGYLQSATDEDRLKVWEYFLRKNTDEILPPPKEELFFDKCRFEYAVKEQEKIRITKFDPDNQTVEMTVFKKKEDKDWEKTNDSFRIIFNSEDFCEFRDKLSKIRWVIGRDIFLKSKKGVELKHPDIEGYCWYCNTVHENPEDCEAW